jgi:hypothetical protein
MFLQPVAEVCDLSSSSGQSALWSPGWHPNNASTTKELLLTVRMEASIISRFFFRLLSIPPPLRTKQPTLQAAAFEVQRQFGRVTDPPPFDPLRAKSGIVIKCGLNSKSMFLGKDDNEASDVTFVNCTETSDGNKCQQMRLHKCAFTLTDSLDGSTISEILRRSLRTTFPAEQSPPPHLFEAGSYNLLARGGHHEGTNSVRLCLAACAYR